MMTDLRNRIAAAIAGVDDWRGVTDPAILADAVIRELELERENWHVDMGVSTLPRHMWVKPPPVHRYVTEWVATND